jgi:hypothetical protein
MHTDSPTRRTAGRLSREDQRRLGDILQRVYDDVVHQGVPDRFRALLNELEEAGKNEQHSAASRAEADMGPGGEKPESDQVFEPEGASEPRSKGPH